MVDSPMEGKMVDAILNYDKMVRAGVIPDLASKGRLLRVPPFTFYFAACICMFFVANPFLLLFADLHFTIPKMMGELGRAVKVPTQVAVIRAGQADMAAIQE